MRRLALLLVLAALALPSAASADPAPESGSSDWRQVSAGQFTTCGVRTNGRAYCWGGDGSGVLGNGGSDVPSQIPVEVAGGETDWAQISMGGSFACGLRTSGRLYCWGADDTGQLGNGAGGTSNTPVQVTGNSTAWTSVSAGEGTACGRRNNGRIYCWGSDGVGQVGNAALSGFVQSPVLVAGGFTDWVGVDVAIHHACGVRANGRTYCWGGDINGELGNGADTTTTLHTPTLVRGGITDWRSITTGGGHTCARRSTGRLYCWGLDNVGQLGNGAPLESRALPVPVVATGPTTDWTAVDAGRFSTCGRRQTGRLYCWGHDDSGQLGNGNPLSDAPNPVQVAGGATDWASVTGGVSHTCARTTTRRLFCWGSDGAGRLGNGGTSIDEPAPDQVHIA